MRTTIALLLVVTASCATETGPETTTTTSSAIQSPPADDATCSEIEHETLLAGSEAGLSEEEVVAELLELQPNSLARPGCWAKYGSDLELCVQRYWGSPFYTQCVINAHVELVRCMLARCFGWGFGWPLRPWGYD